MLEVALSPLGSPRQASMLLLLLPDFQRETVNLGPAMVFGADPNKKHNDYLGHSVTARLRTANPCFLS